MSEPVSNADVEDVLASIRRLVSEDKRPMRAAKAALPLVDNRPLPPAPEESGKLVLTPSLRVAEGSEPSARKEEADLLEEQGDAAFAEVESALQEMEEADILLDVDPDAFEEQMEAEQGGETARQPLILLGGSLPEKDEAPEEDEAVQADEGVEAAHDAEAEAADELQELVEAYASDETALTGDVAETVAEADEVPNEDPATDLAPAEEVARVEEQAENSGDAGDIETDDAETEHNVAETHSGTPPFAMAGSLGEKIAALESMVGRRQDTWEPDGVDKDDYSGTEAPAIDWQEQAQDAPEDEAAETVAETEAPQDAPDAPAADQPDEAPASALDAVQGEEDLLDEEALRDMVAEIVRQELQGALGERITRNVRKLVRREIHRALATRELD